jgi:rod shape-determining protein MreC
VRTKKNKAKKYLNFKVIATSTVAITLIGIIGISIGKVASSNSTNYNFVLNSFSIVESGFSGVSNFIGDQFGDFINFKKNANKVDKIEKENEKLRKEIIDLRSDLESSESLSDLKKALNFIDEDYSAKQISASVVGKNDGNWYTTFVISAGSNQGVKKDSIVASGKGLVGIVYEVSSNYSKAVSLLDSRSSVSFQLLKDPKFKGVITQDVTIDKFNNSKDSGDLKGYMFDISYSVVPGDVLTTSGLGIYPEGIPIGEVKKVIDDKDNALKYVIVKPYVNLKNLKDVLVIEPRTIS